MSTINKYNLITGEKLASYDTLTECAKANNLSVGAVSKMLQQKEIKIPRRDYYISYTPNKPRTVIEVFDNMYFDKLGTYINIKEASKRTGVITQVIQNQVAKDVPIRNAVCGSTGLWFRRVVIKS